MKLLLHICCAPCAVYPLDVLTAGGIEVMGYFYRNNIHPFQECMRREQTLTDFAADIGLKVIYQKGYDLEGFLRNVVFRESERCRLCYHARLEATGLLAKRGKFDAFSTTLLYSKFQKHDQVKTAGEAVAQKCGVPFYYQDFRLGWKAGIEKSKRRKMYRQQYCGCIYSEKERFYKPGKSKQ